MGEGDESQAGAFFDNFAYGDALCLCHKAQGSEHTDTRQQLKPGVGEAHDGARTGQVGLGFQVGGVGDHNTEADGEREEDLP